jgi:hypothetical protein
MLNQVVLVGKLKYVYSSFDVVVLDVDGQDIKIDLPVSLHNAVNDKRIGDMVAIKGKITEGMHIQAERMSFIEADKNLTNN